jgi:hypothetical protein
MDFGERSGPEPIRESALRETCEGGQSADPLSAALLGGTQRVQQSHAFFSLLGRFVQCFLSSGMDWKQKKPPPCILDMMLIATTGCDNQAGFVQVRLVFHLCFACLPTQSNRTIELWSVHCI